MTKLNQCSIGLAVCGLLIALGVGADAQILTTLANTPGYARLMSLIQGIDGNFYGVTENGGGHSRVHVHSGVEAIYTVDGELLIARSYHVTYITS